MKKTNYYCILLITLSLFLSSCKSSDSTDESSNENLNVSMSSLLDYSFTDKGITYISDESILHYFDIESGYDTAICSKANCTHEGESSTNPTPDCDGFVEGIDTTCTAVIGDNLYFLYTPNIDNDDYSGFSYKKLCRADTDGTNRKDIAEISDAQSITVARYSENYLILGYSSTFDENGENLEKSRSTVSAINLNDGTVISTDVKENYQGQIRSVYISDDDIYYAYFYLSESVDYDEWDLDSEEFSEYIDSISQLEIIDFNIKDNSENILWSSNATCNDMNYGYVCVNDKIPKIIRLSDMNIFSFEAEYSDCSFTIDKDGVIIRNSENKTYFLNFESEEIEEIQMDADTDFIISAVTDNTIFLNYYNESDYVMGCIEKEDFYSGKINSLKFIKKFK
ncbi:MAG: hypothetical protein LUE12_07540 [Ruminococcus sp.]|nr:hypothetical protein [Ruminococcus sp.]